ASDARQTAAPDRKAQIARSAAPPNRIAFALWFMKTSISPGGRRSPEERRKNRGRRRPRWAAGAKSLGREAGPSPGLGAEEARANGIVLELAPQASDVHPQRVARDAGRRPPDLAHELPMRPDGAGLLQHRRQDREFERRQVNGPARLLHDAGVGVDLDVA